MIRLFLQLIIYKSDGLPISLYISITIISISPQVPYFQITNCTSPLTINEKFNQIYFFNFTY